MPFEIKEKTEKDAGTYRTLYLPERLKEQVETLANNSGSNFNRVVVEMIEYCLKNMEGPQE